MKRREFITLLGGVAQGKAGHERTISWNSPSRPKSTNCTPEYGRKYAQRKFF
jgi:hypothetical protein